MYNTTVFRNVLFSTVLLSRQCFVIIGVVNMLANWLTLAFSMFDISLEILATIIGYFDVV